MGTCHKVLVNVALQTHADRVYFWPNDRQIQYHDNGKQVLKALTMQIGFNFRIEFLLIFFLIRHIRLRNES